MDATKIRQDAIVSRWRMYWPQNHMDLGVLIRSPEVSLILSFFICKMGVKSYPVMFLLDLSKRKVSSLTLGT